MAIHPILDKDRQDMERTLAHLAEVVAATSGNHTEVANVEGKSLTVSDLGQLVAAVVAIQGAHDHRPGYRRAMDDMLYAFGYVLHGLGIRQSRTAPVGGAGPNRAQRRAAKRR